MVACDGNTRIVFGFFFFFSSRRRHTRLQGDWSSDVCSSDLSVMVQGGSTFGSIGSAFVAQKLVGSKGLWAAGYVTADSGATTAFQMGALGSQEIGRASCRERV